MMLENGGRDGEKATRQEAKEEEWSDGAPVRAFGRASFSHWGPRESYLFPPENLPLWPSGFPLIPTTFQHPFPDDQASKT